MSYHNVFYMNSFSRSGETLMLRCLNAHERVHVVHQILSKDTPEDFALFRKLRTYSETKISAADPIVSAVRASPGSILLCKNAVWTHQYPHKGFALVRNPLSVFRSFGIASEDGRGYAKRRSQMFRWALGVDPNICVGMGGASNLEVFCSLYNRKIYDIAKSGMPVIYYENFVREPRRSLAKILSVLGVEWSDLVLRSHESYAEGDLGHGRIKLWQDIHQGSLHGYKKLPDSLIQRVLSLTWPAFREVGYDFKEGFIEVPEDAP